MRRRKLKKINKNRTKINKRILKEREEKRKGCISMVVFILIFSSPLWFYRGILHEVVLPIWGEKSKAVLSGLMEPASWSGRYGIPHYSYSFYSNGKLYEKDSNISTKNASYQLGDSVDIIYLKKFPFISSCISPRKVNDSLGK